MWSSPFEAALKREMERCQRYGLAVVDQLVVVAMAAAARRFSAGREIGPAQRHTPSCSGCYRGNRYLAPRFCPSCTTTPLSSKARITCGQVVSAIPDIGTS